MQTKILIIKLGYSETLDPEISKVVSLGDVLRTTPILIALKEKFPDSHITWLVTESAEPLLKGNKLIDRILIWDQFVPFQLMKEKIDVLINLEKIPGVAALADMIDAWTKYGFRFDSNTGSYHTYERSLGVMHYIERKKTGQVINDFWQKVLIEMIGITWKNQPCVIGYQPRNCEAIDIGLNYQVGPKWPNKAMPYGDWQKLEALFITSGYSTSWQDGLSDIYQYIDWVNSCETIISNDSLGIHIALSLGKRVVGLFGPTDPQEVYMYGKGNIIYSHQECPQMPCYSCKCKTDLQCMQKIDLNEIVTAVQTNSQPGKPKVVPPV